MQFLCPTCRGPLTEAPDHVISCPEHGRAGMRDKDGRIVFDGCMDKHSFFEKQAHERLDRYYDHVGPAEFEDILARREMWEMDPGNKWVGISRKFWWEDYTGRIEGKKVLELGCGVNYITSYFLRCGNELLAFDICKESIDYQEKLFRKTGVDTQRLTVAVANAETVELPGEFDYVDISNVLHHIHDKQAALDRAFRALKPGGRVLIVEPNYYYPLRWMIETDAFDPFNFVKSYFVRKYLMEKDEKAIIFPGLLQLVRKAGFEVEVNEKDRNFFGAFVTRLVPDRSVIARAIFWLDWKLFGPALPRSIAPFQYIVAKKPAA